MRMKNVFKYLLGLMAFWLLTNSVYAELRTSISQYGITWTFSAPAECGQFVTGDWWVVGPVTIASVSPAPTSGRNGSCVNPMGNRQGYDSRGGSYSTIDNVSFPYTLQADQSLVSTNSKPEGVTIHNVGCIQSQAVLTGVSTVQSEGTFRPSYASAYKKYFSESQINYTYLPNLPKPASAPFTGNSLINYTDMPKIDHFGSWVIQYSCAQDNFANGVGYPCYGRDYSTMISQAMMYTMLNTPEKNELVNNLIQIGIDNYGVLQAGGGWGGDGGHHSGRKAPIVFAAQLLGDPDMLQVGDYPSKPKGQGGYFGENDQTYYGLNKALFGIEAFNTFCVSTGAKDQRDPAKLQDACGYRVCCTSHTWVGQMLTMLMIDAKSIWNHDAYFDYVDRWMSGDVQDGGSSSNTFIDDMWATYRTNLPTVGDTIHVTGVSVSPTSLNIDIGASGSITKTIIPSNATNQSVTWSSSNTAIATVDAFGSVLGVGLGTCSVTVTTADGGFTASCSVEVSPVGTNPSNVAVNKLITVSAYQDDANGTFPGTNLVDGDVSDATRWSAEGFPQWAVIDLENIYDLSSIELYTYQSRDYQYIVEASLDGNSYTTIVDRSTNTQGSGLVDAVNFTARYVKITVSGANSYAGTWSSLNELKVIGLLSSVTPTPVTGVSVSPTSLNLEVGQTSDLTETVSPPDATNKTVVWTSDNTSIATVNSSGLVSAVSAGTATITVTTNDGGFTDNCSLTVTAVPVTGVTLAPTSLNLEVGQTSDLTETVSPANATDKTVVWSSDNTSIATVNSSGLVTAVAEGAATITVTTNDGSYTATCDVTVTYTPPPVGGYYCDPITGDISNDGSQTSPWPSLQAVIAAGKTFADGEFIYLMNGNHGTPVITEDNTADVTITRAPGHNPVIQRIAFVGASHWVLDNVDVSSGGIQVPINPPLEHPVYPIVQNTMVEISGSCSYITLDNCYIYSVDNSSSWTADDWNYKAWSGISHKESDHVTIRNCYFKNINFGIDNNGTISNTLYEYNTVENFNGDGLRAHGANMVIQYNTVKNSYTTNGNHGDMLQTVGTTYGVIIRNNKFLVRTDPNQPFQGGCQGIGLFDGMYYDFVIENNLVVIDHWNGITLLGTENCKVVNNTLIDINNVDPGPAYIKIAAHKNGTPSTGNLVRNNLCTDLSNDGGIGVVDNNIEITWFQYDTYFNDFANGDYSLKAGCNAIDAGSSSQAPTIDIDGNARDANVDIGCYEYNGVPPVPVSVTGVSVSPVSLSIDVGQSSDLTETISPYNATDKSVAWSSSNTSIATVDANGMVSGIAVGSCTVTVTTNDGGFTANCAVTINPEGTTPTNVALNKPVTVSAYQDDGGGTYPGSNLVDGDVSDATRWSAETFPQWAEIDLQANYDLSSIELYTYQSRDYQYIVEAKPDGGSYTTIVDRSLNTQGSGLVDAVSTTARYVKITVSGANTYAGTWSSLNELIVMGVPASGATIPVTGVTLSSTNLTLDEGQTSDLDKTVLPANATDKSVTWSTSNASIATVDANGLVTAVSAGNAIITVTTNDGGYTATCDVTVNVVSVEVNLALNKPITVSAYQDDANGYKPGENLVDGDVSDDARWSASGFPQWAEIDLGANYNLNQIDLYPYLNRAYQYIVEAKPEGGSYTTIVDKSANTESADLLVSPVNIVARYVKITVSGLYGSTSTWVSLSELEVWGTVIATVPVTGVSLSASSLTLDEGQTSDLDETVAPANATDPSVTWSTGNASIATVDANGLVTAVSAGNTTITVTTIDGGYTATCDVTVNVPVIPVTGVSLSASSLTLDEGQTSDLDETVVPANATDKSVTWSTGNGSIATVDANGLVTAVSAGNTTITVTTNDGGFTATCDVTVNVPVILVTGVSLSVSSLTLDEGQTSDLDETVAPANATDPSVTWSTGNASIATVDANGLVTAVSAGNTIITVTTNDGGFTATCNVEVSIVDPIIANIVGYWPMDEITASVTPDESDNSNNGTVAGATITTGQISNALNFDGSNDKVSLGNLDVTPSNGNDGLTLAAWINPDQWISGTYRDDRIISKATGTDEQDHYWMLSPIKDVTYTRLRFRLKTGSTTTTLISSSGDIQLDMWTHVAATYDGNSMKVYINGTEVGSASKTGTVATSSSVETTLGINPDNARPFDGQIDEVYILDRALSGQEISDLMTRNSESHGYIEQNLSVKTETILKIYPNPLNGNVLNIRLKGYDNFEMINVNIVDLTGRSVYNRQYYQTELQIPVNNLSKGIYIISVNGKQQKLVVE